MWKERICIISLLAMVLAGAGGDFVFKVQLPFLEFASTFPQRTVRDGRCCECCEDPVSGHCLSACNATLLICIREADHPLADNSCPLGEITAPANSNTTELSGTFQGPWEGIAQVSIPIFHYNESVFTNTDVSTAASQHLLDLIFIDQIVLPPSAPPTVITSFNGAFGTVTLLAMFQVVCAPNFFSDDCSMMCENRDDSLGHFTCDPATGEKVCLEGYQDVEENCTTCVPSPGCSPTGGICNEPGECICLSFLGYSGENCTERTSDSTSSQLPSSFAFSPASQEVPPPTSGPINLISSTAELPFWPTQSTMMLQTAAISFPSTPVMELLPTSAGVTTPTARVQATPMTTPIAVANRMDPGNGRTIIIGATVGAVIFMLISSVIFALIMVQRRRSLKRRAIGEQEPRTESRFTNSVIPNFGTSSRYTSCTTLDNVDPYLDVTPLAEDGISTLTHPPTFSTFQQSDSGILSQGTIEDEHIYMPTVAVRKPSESEQIGQVSDEDLGYAKPVIINRTPEHKQALHQDHEYAVLECETLVKEESSACREGVAEDGECEDLQGPVCRGVLECDDLVTKKIASCKDDDVLDDECEEFAAEKGFDCQDGTLDDADLLESIERTVMQITQDLQDSIDQEELSRAVSTESDFSFIYS